MKQTKNNNTKTAFISRKISTLKLGTNNSLAYNNTQTAAHFWNMKVITTYKLRCKPSYKNRICINRIAIMINCILQFKSLGGLPSTSYVRQPTFRHCKL